MTGRTILLSYADAPFAGGQAALCESARRVGFDAIKAASPADIIGSEFHARHRTILDQRRGGGFWLWKPYLILDHLRQLNDDDVLF